MNTTTTILRQAGDYFIAETTDGRLRVGILDTAAVDTTREHERIRAVAQLELNSEFENEAAALFDDLFSGTERADGSCVAFHL